MSYPYTKDQLVEQLAIGLFTELDWTLVSVMEDPFGASGMSPYLLVEKSNGEVL